jgi:hypothetical protein
MQQEKFPSLTSFPSTGPFSQYQTTEPVSPGATATTMTSTMPASPPPTKQVKFPMFARLSEPMVQEDSAPDLAKAGLSVALQGTPTPDSAYKQAAWQSALAKAGLSVALKGTPNYQRVLKIYLDEELPAVEPMTAKIWAACCRKYTDRAFVSKVHPEFGRVSKAYRILVEAHLNGGDGLDMSLIEGV